MAFLFGGAGDKVAAQQTPAIANIQIQTASYGLPIPIVYGTQRVPGNVIWHGDFTATPHDEKREAGKGGAEVQEKTYTYTASIMLAVCEGPITEFYRVWVDKNIGSFPGDQGFEVYDVGPRSNTTPWTFLTTNHPTKAVPYGGTAYVAAAALPLPDATLRNHTFEIKGFSALYIHNYTDPLGHAGVGYDAHPKDIIGDLLTNKEYGLGWDPARLNFATGSSGTSASSFTNYCHALGFYLSLGLSAQSTALELVQQLLASTNSAAVWSQGILKFLPYGDTSATGNSFTYTPYLTVLYDLSGDDFLPVADMDPISIERSNLQDAFNAVPIEYMDRAQDYKQTIAEDPEQADIEAFGLRRADPLNAHFICRAEVAMAISRLRAQRFIWIRNSYSFRLPLRYILLEPMDLVSLSEPKLGLDKKVVRIKTIEEDEEGNFNVTAEEWPFGTGTHTLYAPQTGDGTTINFSEDPGDAVAPVAFIPTLAMTAGELELWLVTTGGPEWGGADVYVSDDTTTFSFAGTTFAARWGQITAGISSSATSIDVDLSVSNGSLTSTTAAGAADDLTALWLDGEAVSYQTATLTGPNTYTLTGCLRGRQGTVAASHSSGAYVVRLDGGVFKHPLAYTRLGTNIYIKLVSFNRVGGGKQDISTLSYYTFSIPAAPALLPAPTNVTIDIGTSPH
jgi:hypothetical protein